MSKNNPKLLIIHHTGGTDADPLADSSGHTFELVNQYHKDNPAVNLGHPSSLGFYIGYHYFIDKLGKVTQGRADTDEGAHTVGQNLNSLGICLAGNFDATMPTEAQKNALATLLRQKMAQYSIPVTSIVPHRTYAHKTCYGKHLTDTWAQELVREKPLPTTPSTTPPTNTDLIDGIRAHLTGIEALLGKIK